jgi:hypothetical protein
MGKRFRISVLVHNFGYFITSVVHNIDFLLYFNLFHLLIRNPLPHSVKNSLGMNVTDWPAFKASVNISISPDVMELNPYNFGHLYNDPYRHNCDELWKQYFD